MKTQKSGPTLHKKLGHLSSDIWKEYNKLTEIYKKFWKSSEDEDDVQAPLNENPNEKKQKEFWIREKNKWNSV